MSDFLQYLRGVTDSNIEVGIVEDPLDKRKYRVRVKNRSIVLKSAVDRVLNAGEQVIINKTKYERYIVGVTDRKNTHNQKEVVIDG